MYSIYAGNLCIYDDTYISDEYRQVEPVLTLEDSAAGSLEFTLLPTSLGYSTIKRMSTEIIVKKNGEEIWSGRVLSESTDFLNKRSLYCEGELAYLNDSTQPPAEYHDLTVRGFLERLLQVHNAKVGEDKQFHVGIVTVTDSNDSLYRYTNFEKTLECINEKLINRLNGHIRIRKVAGVRYLDYLADYPNTNSQVINFGENLLDFTKSFDMSELATVIVPLGASLDENPIEALQAYLDVSSVNNGSIYVKSETALANYGWIEKVIHWDDVENASNLLSKAQRYLRDTQFEEMQLEVSAVDLNYLYVNTESIKLLDEIRVVSEPHGLDRLFPVTKMTIPLDSPENSKFTMGSKVKLTLTQVNNQTNTEILDRIDNFPPPSSILQEARDNASQLIQNATNGYVTILSNAGKTQEILITNLPDYAQATKVWRWNINGLGYSSTGYNGEYGLAMTMDGAIVADRITAGTMYADRIKGGTLTLGGVDNSNGVLMVKNGNGDIVCQMNNTGAEILGSFKAKDNLGYWLELRNGKILGGRNSEEYGTIDATCEITNTSSGITRKGFSVKTDAMNILCEELAVMNNYTDIPLTGGTGVISIVNQITENANGTITWTTTPYHFINGILVTSL